MADPNPLICEQCGASLEGRAPGRGCLNCLMRGGLGEEMEVRNYQHYQILTRADGSLWELGRGAMGVTYKARDLNLDTEVALKIIGKRLSADPAARQRLLREARATARLRHPNVASVFHFGMPSASDETEGNGEWFYAMEFIEGENLEAHLRRSGPLEPPAVLTIALQISHALQAAEKHGIVHRDLKPSNIMLVADDASHQAGRSQTWVKVIDFGLAEVVAGVGSSHSGSSSLKPSFSGTPEFASPEQISGRGVNPRSDIFSLGVTLWYLLSGKLPFAATRAPGTESQFGSLPLEQLHAAQVPVRVIELLQAMLAVSPDDRPSAETLRALASECLAACEQHGDSSMGKAMPPEDLRRSQELYRLAKNALGGSVPTQVRFEEAILHLQEILLLDPASVQALALLAETHAQMYRKSFDRSAERAQQVLSAAEAALRLRPGSGEARRALGIYYYYIQRDYGRADAEFHFARQALPEDGETLFCLGLTARRQNRWADAVFHFAEAAARDPYHPDYGTHWWKTLSGLRRYPEARAVLDRLIAQHPEHIHLRVHRAYLAYSETADLRPLHETLAQLPTDYDPNGSITFLRVGIARYECDPDAADRYLAASPLSFFQGHVDGQIYTREGLHFLNIELRGDKEQVRQIVTQMLPYAAAYAQATPDEPGPLMTMGLLQATLGQRAEALESGHRALSLLPPEKDGVDGPMLAIQLAWIHIILGEFAPAIDLLQTYAPWAGGLSYGDLALGNMYFPLRPDPLFPDLLRTLSHA